MATEVNVTYQRMTSLATLHSREQVFATASTSLDEQYCRISPTSSSGKSRRFVMLRLKRHKDDGTTMEWLEHTQSTSTWRFHKALPGTSLRTFSEGGSHTLRPVRGAVRLHAHCNNVWWSERLSSRQRSEPPMSEWTASSKSSFDQRESGIARDSTKNLLLSDLLPQCCNILADKIQMWRLPLSRHPPR